MYFGGWWRCNQWLPKCHCGGAALVVSHSHLLNSVLLDVTVLWTRGQNLLMKCFSTRPTWAGSAGLPYLRSQPPGEIRSSVCWGNYWQTFMVTCSFSSMHACSFHTGPITAQWMKSVRNVAGFRLGVSVWNVAGYRLVWSWTSFAIWVKWRRVWQRIAIS